MYLMALVLEMNILVSLLLFIHKRASLKVK